MLLLKIRVPSTILLLFAPRPLKGWETILTLQKSKKYFNLDLLLVIFNTVECLGLNFLLNLGKMSTMISSKSIIHKRTGKHIKMIKFIFYCGEI